MAAIDVGAVPADALRPAKAQTRETLPQTRTLNPKPYKPSKSYMNPTNPTSPTNPKNPVNPINL